MKQLKIIVVLLFLIHSAFAQDKPNILWIVTDDQRADALSCYNRAVFGTEENQLGYVESPFIDQLAEEGVLFTNAYCNSPACAPSRGSMQTGKYPHHSGIYGFEQTHLNASHCDLTIPEEMKSLGYKTSRFGKGGFYIFEWEDKITWTPTGKYSLIVDMKNNLQKHGFTDFYKNKIWGEGSKEEWHYPDGTMKAFWYERDDNTIPPYDVNLRAEIEEQHDVLRSYTRDNELLILGGLSPQPAPNTLDGRITESFQMYLENANKTYQALDGTQVEGPKTAQPQFLHIGYHFPHTPVLPPKSFRDKFKNKMYRIPNFSEEELEKLPWQLQNLHTKMKVDKMTYDEKQQFMRDYFAFCAMGDSLIGAAVNSFKTYCENQDQEYLVVIACGDHGWHLGEQGISAKFGPYKQSNHTAILAISSDKEKYPENTVIERFTEFVDFAPTFLAAAGEDEGNEKFGHLDGYDLVKVINGKAIDREYVLGEMNHVINDRAYLRSADFAFSMRARDGWRKPSEGDILTDVKWPLTTTRENAELALFDLRVDRNEQNNVANNIEYIELADWFRTKLGNIVLGDGRVECDWTKANLWDTSNFALGSDDKILDIPAEFIPAIEDVQIAIDSFWVDTLKVEVEEGKSAFISAYFEPFNTTFKQLEWISENTNIATVSDGLITGNEMGETTITATSNKNPGLSQVISVIVTENTDISSLKTPGTNVQSNQIINVYPNPANNSIFYNADGTVSAIKAYDITGRTILADLKFSSREIDISSLDAGIYALHFSFKNNRQTTIQIIKK